MNEEISFWVMNATADDWESLDQISNDIKHEFPELSREEIAVVMHRLLLDGLVEAMPRKPKSFKCIVASPTEFWFRMTPTGRILWEAQALRFTARHHSE